MVGGGEENACVDSFSFVGLQRMLGSRHGSLIPFSSEELNVGDSDTAWWIVDLRIIVALSLSDINRAVLSGTSPIADADLNAQVLS